MPPRARPPRAREFTDTRHGLVQCCCSSFSRQIFFATLPLFILIVILFGVNSRDHQERSHTVTTITVSSGEAVAHLVREVLQTQVDALASMTQLVKNKAWTDPYALNQFLEYAFPIVSVDVALHRIGVTHNDNGNSYIALTAATADERGQVQTGARNTPWSNVFVPELHIVREVVEVQSRLYGGGALSRYARSFSEGRSVSFVDLKQPQTPEYQGATRSAWIGVADALIAATADSFGTDVTWGRWLAGNNSFVVRDHEFYHLPSLIFQAPIAGREGQPGGKLIGRVTVRENYFGDLFLQTGEGKRPIAFLLDWTTDFIMASTEGRVGVHYINEPELQRFQTEIVQVRERVPFRHEHSSGRVFIASRVNVDWAPFVLITLTANNSQLEHDALQAAADLSFRAAFNLAEAVRYHAQAGDFYDIDDIPQMEKAIGGAYKSIQGVIGDLYLSNDVRRQVHRFYGYSAPQVPGGQLQEHAPRIESWWMPDGNLPVRRYELTRADSDVGDRMLLKRQFVEYYNRTSPRTNPSESFSRMRVRVDQMGTLQDDELAIHGPDSETAEVCGYSGALQNLCQYTYFTLSSCASWPRGVVLPSQATLQALRGGDIANRSCFHLQFTPDELLRALNGMRLDLVGLTVIAFDDGTVIAAAGESVPLGTETAGQMVWQVVPTYTQGNWAFVKGVPYGQEVELDGRHFILERVNVPVTRSPRGNVVVLTVIDNKVADNTRRTVILYAIDGVVVLCFFLFVAHSINFVSHMRNMGRVATIVDAAAELQTDRLPEEALRVWSLNKDMESMLISSVQLFLHMKRIRECLPQYIVEAHWERGTVDGSLQPPDTARAISNLGAAANEAAGSAQTPVFSSMTANSEMRMAYNLKKQQMVFVSVLMPSAQFVASEAGASLFARLERAASAQGGAHWMTDATLLTHFYFDGDHLTRAIGVAKTFATIAPQCVVIVVRDDCTFGLIAADKNKSFAIAGPVVDTVRCIAATARCVLGSGESTAAMAGAEPRTSEGSPRKTAIVLSDQATLLRSDPSSLAESVARTVGALPAETDPDDLPSVSEVAAAIRAHERISIAAMQGCTDRNAIVIREVLLAPLEEEPLDNTQRLLWTGIGDAAAALVEKRVADAKTLLQVITQHDDVARSSVYAGGKWDVALQSAIAVNAAGRTAAAA